MTLLNQNELDSARQNIQSISKELNRLLLGRELLHEQVLVALLAKGHVLLEGLPGLGKTALIRVLGHLLNLQFSRIQCTPDLMPGDILGTHILQEKAGESAMVFQPGPVFTNVLLADEINRASPKTQSALLEAMQEARVTLMGETRSLPLPFFVMASQNPIEQHGTYPLPEAQLDRFLFKLHVDGLDLVTLSQLANSRPHGDLPEPEFQLEEGALQSLFEAADRIHIAPQVADYVASLVHATHPQSEFASEQVQQYVQFGASPRAVFALTAASRARALFHGRPTVGFEDVKAVTKPALNHRMVLHYQARIDQVTVFDLIDSLLERDPSGLQLPKGAKLGQA